MTVRISTVQLGGCSGCHVSTLDVGRDLFSKEITVVHSYLLLDLVTATIEADTDVLLVEGAILTHQDEQLVKRMRRHAKIVVAIGSCACFGGIACLGNLGTPFAPPRDGCAPSAHTLHPLICSPKAFARIDHFIPGCPPPHEVIASTLLALVDGRRVSEIAHTVCDECERKRTATPPPIPPGGRWKTELDRAPDPEVCLLEQGYLCLGRQTLGGCGAACAKANLPCEGCRGPLMSHRGFVEFSDDEIKDVMRCLR